MEEIERENNRKKAQSIKEQDYSELGLKNSSGGQVEDLPPQGNAIVSK